MAGQQKARLLGWTVDTLESTSYKTTHELIQTLANRPGGRVFDDITALINKYENEFLSDQQHYERDCIGAKDRAVKYSEHISQQPQFKQSLINGVIYLVEKTNFDEFFSHAGNKEYVDELLSYKF